MSAPTAPPTLPKLPAIAAPNVWKLQDLKLVGTLTTVSGTDPKYPTGTYQISSTLPVELDVMGNWSGTLESSTFVGNYVATYKLQPPTTKAEPSLYTGYLLYTVKLTGFNFRYKMIPTFSLSGDQGSVSNTITQEELLPYSLNTAGDTLTFKSKTLTITTNPVLDGVPWSQALTFTGRLTYAAVQIPGSNPLALPPQPVKPMVPVPEIPKVKS